MPHIEINKDEFDKLVGKQVTEKTLREEASFLGVHWNPVEGKKWDVEVYPNRPDLLSVEGLARAYRGYLDIETGLEEFEIEQGSNKVRKEKSVEEVRPYIGAAIVRGLDLDERTINGLVQLQEKLHVSYGRKRDKIAIGLHDIEEIEPPFTYKAVTPEDASFTPLDHDEELHLNEILENHEKGQEYGWILESEKKYPVIVDYNDNVLSFPPIINNHLTEVENNTQDIFVDVTGKDKTTVEKTLNIIVAALHERGGNIETVKVDGQHMPDMSPEEFEIDAEYINGISGLNLSEQDIKERLEKMRYGVQIDEEEGLSAEVPAYRTDVMHQYDLVEDTVIAHGYNNISPELPEVDQDGELTSLTSFTDELRDIMLRAGVLETNTYALTKEEDLYQKMEIERDENQITLQNPMTEEYSTVRSWLTPSLLEVLQQNKHNTYPQEFFEVEDVAKKTDNYKGTGNIKKMAYVTAGDIDYNNARQTLQAIERDLGISFKLKKDFKEFHKHSRSAKIIYDDQEIGFIGEFSEEIQENWVLDKKIAGFEIDVEKLMKQLQK